jgi:hypothetical protein
MSKEDIQAEIDAKHRMLSRAQTLRQMWALLAITHLAALFLPLWAPVMFLGIGLFLWLLGYAESMRLVREISKLAKRRQAIEEHVEAFVEERGEAIRRRMAAMLEAEARAKFKHRGSPSMFKGHCIDITPEQS